MSNKIIMLFTIANIDINRNNENSLGNIQESLQNTQETLQENWLSILNENKSYVNLINLFNRFRAQIYPQIYDAIYNNYLYILY